MTTKNILNLRALLLTSACVLVAGAPLANATVISFVTPSGSNDSAGDPVNAKVTFTTGAGTVAITLANNQTGMKDAGQTLSDLLFTISTGQNSGTVSSSSGLERNVNSDKTFTDGSTVAAGWVLTTSGASLHLDVLAGTGHAGPAHTILGPATGSTYPNANGSIAGNGPHNPFLDETVTFNINVTGVTAGSTISAATFSFGTTDGADTINGVPAPEPSTLILAAPGGLALLAMRRRRRT